MWGKTNVATANDLVSASLQVAAAFENVFVPNAAAAAAATADLGEAIGWDPGTDAAFEVLVLRDGCCLQSRDS